MTRTLSLKFGTDSGDTRSVSLSDPKTTLTASEANAAMGAVVTAGQAFADPVTSAIKDELINREVTVLVDNE